MSETRHLQALHTALNFAASLGPTSLTICISRSVGTRSKAPKQAVEDVAKDDDDDDDDVDSVFEPLRLDTDSHTFLIKVVIISLPRTDSLFLFNGRLEEFYRENVARKFHGRSMETKGSWVLSLSDSRLVIGSAVEKEGRN